MSEDRRTLVERVFRALNERDLATLDAIADTDFEFHSVFVALEGGTVFRGRKGIRAMFAMLDSVWEDLAWRVESVRDADDKSLIFLRMAGTARASGFPLDQPAAFVWTWRDGKILRSDSFTDTAKALEAAGISE